MRIIEVKYIESNRFLEAKYHFQYQQAGRCTSYTNLPKINLKMFNAHNIIGFCNLLSIMWYILISHFYLDFSLKKNDCAYFRYLKHNHFA